MSASVIEIWSQKSGLPYTLQLIVPFFACEHLIDSAHDLGELAECRDWMLTAGINYET